ncbi:MULTISPECIES: FG-GAP and VCBS repeat-containing protein [Dyadobacter]|uniref:FG-GAP and VCBS repeat-containing protein n=1 Tax=Dyadobacter chenhuakuii TaxID=2909339 RepID=A0A9X1QIC9_9BACT|nr:MULTISPECIES: FG-GAP and VCBS repeat-containing protein [Dyadobacter]MCF2491764.1 FG-GAP and VCBS repeat-containing protein [Dyadobacter chenhuakuii]MCF2501389.1 FG-GAP and VCBS repeat-containing protein [Dyadobacter chenhuakuii]MCF2516398.1 FG-GAP and VCBS repeat-containing protein [Dyadobacter sp. CY351]USJ29072.1 FG-GAP and VCBS repeat-containing protein [Dyadobacter chenhuakuii]
MKRKFLLFALTLVAAKTVAQTATFVGEVIDDKISIGYGVTSGDVDGDGKPDILLADKKEIVWYKNPGKKAEKWTRYVIARDLTEQDNVCIAARDIDGDGKVEVAVGAQWNPSETKNLKQSGAVYYLSAPSDRTQLWEPVRLHHEVTIHRMQWLKKADGTFQLAVLPLHGEGNSGGEGAGVKLIAFDVPQNKTGIWGFDLVETGMHMTHNMHPMEVPGRMLGLAVAGKEGVQVFLDGAEGLAPSGTWMVPQTGVGEVRTGSLGKNQLFTATIEPMHGNTLVVYSKDNRTVLTDKIKEGHALVCADFFGQGRDQVVMGWRNPNVTGETGVRIFVGSDPEGKKWQEYALDDKIKIACEDITAADLDGDGDLDILASGRSTHNVVVYWNQKKK